MGGSGVAGVTSALMGLYPFFLCSFSLKPFFPPGQSS